MRTVHLDPNITPEIRASRQARMAERAAEMSARIAELKAAHRLAVELADACKSIGPPLTADEFEAELDRRDAEAAAAQAPCKE